MRNITIVAIVTVFAVFAGSATPAAAREPNPVVAGAFAGQCESKGECKEQLASLRTAVKAEKAETRAKAKAAKEVAAVEKMRAQIAALQSKAK
jgi:hypothetical protein